MSMDDYLQRWNRRSKTSDGNEREQNQRDGVKSLRSGLETHFIFFLIAILNIPDIPAELKNKPFKIDVGKIHYHS